MQTATTTPTVTPVVAPTAAPAPGAGAPDDGPPTGGTPVRSRLATLARAMDGRSRTRPRADLSKVLIGLGITVLALGVVDALLGWYGAAHSPYLYQEIPYLISGGLLGVCLAITGGTLVVSGWVARVLAENRRHTVVLARTVDKLERSLRDRTAAAAPGAGELRPLGPTADVDGTGR
jgi:hypothetical protein